MEILGHTECGAERHQHLLVPRPLWKLCTSRQHTIVDLSTNNQLMLHRGQETCGQVVFRGTVRQCTKEIRWSISFSRDRADGLLDEKRYQIRIQGNCFDQLRHNLFRVSSIIGGQNSSVFTARPPIRNQGNHVARIQAQ